MKTVRNNPEDSQKRYTEWKKPDQTAIYCTIPFARIVGRTEWAIHLSTPSHTRTHLIHLTTLPILEKKKKLLSPKRASHCQERTHKGLRNCISESWGRLLFKNRINVGCFDPALLERIPERVPGGVHSVYYSPPPNFIRLQNLNKSSR